MKLEKSELERIEADKELHYAFQLCDNGNKGYLTKTQFMGFIKLFCATTLKKTITDNQAE